MRICFKIRDLDADEERLLNLEMLLEKLLEPSSFRHLKFMANLMENDNISLLQDCTADGKEIDKDLVLYIKKLK